MKKTIEILTTWEAVRPFISDPELISDYKGVKEYGTMQLSDDYSIQFFLDNVVPDINRLTPEQCELFELEYDDGYYKSPIPGETHNVLL